MSTVTIACKLPNGIWLEVEGAKPVRINGWNNNAIIGAEHGLTENVPADLWEAWLKLHGDTKLVKGGFIFAHGNEKALVAKAKEQKDNKSGLEQLPKMKATDKAGAVGAVDSK